MIDKEDGSVSEEKAEQYLVAVPKAFRNLPFRLRPAKQGEPVADIWWALYDWACLHGYNEYVRMMTAGLFIKTWQYSCLLPR